MYVFHVCYFALNSFRGVEVGSMNSEGEESESEQHQQQLNSFSLAVPEIVTGIYIPAT